ncbi:hypothetical protein CEXT_403701 [Caerostris extrusa]|uniref:Uncharacterized protein n=1 Tax=Caerostris extrusa TaxID=172846 RepID=A0AAV4QRZ0_CAEEX|nr:hypothetical protein CEXT_403701 [Caerostris extrusa]
MHYQAPYFTTFLNTVNYGDSIPSKEIQVKLIIVLSPRSYLRFLATVLPLEVSEGAAAPGGGGVEDWCGSLENRADHCVKSCQNITTKSPQVSKNLHFLFR